MARPFTLADFDFDLPPDLIAQHPLAERSASRLLDARVRPSADRIVRELPALLVPGDLLVFNDTKVIKARLMGHKLSGGALEVLVEQVLADPLEFTAHIRASRSPVAGSVIHLGDDRGLGFEATVLGRCGPEDALFHLRVEHNAFDLLERHGHVPLPPYITHADGADDEQRYQTVFARQAGAVAAPTASLHFDQALLDGLVEAGVALAHVTLHVGAGTFQPVRVDDLSQHRMHHERFEVPKATVAAIEACRERGGRVVAVGTTSLRALESAARTQQNQVQALMASSRSTDLFITPGFVFQVVDTLITNFHLPKSTLLMLVSAFAGYEPMRQLYREAIERRYRFFSYGDAMMLDKQDVEF